MGPVEKVILKLPAWSKANALKASQSHTVPLLLSIQMATLITVAGMMEENIHTVCGVEVDNQWVKALNGYIS